MSNPMDVEELIKRLRKIADGYFVDEPVHDLLNEAASALTRIHNEAIEKAAKEVEVQAISYISLLCRAEENHEIVKFAVAKVADALGGVARSILSLKFDLGSESVAHSLDDQRTTQSGPA